ncbi:MAG: helix-turn-helix transcriptional regulator [Pirellulaceae bacterium]|nr:helix-turn-helix transcriptional regulator [Pirellulaceae bacterium]
MPTAFPSVSPGTQTLSLIASAACDSQLNGDQEEPCSQASIVPELTSASQPPKLSQTTAPRTSEPTAQHTHDGSVHQPSGRGSARRSVTPRRYHRIAEVRAQQALSLRTISRRTGLEVKELRRQEDATTDLSLSELMLWQKALEVPLVDLLEDESDVLSRPVKERAQMVRIMKTVVSLGEASQGNLRLTRLSAMLREQMLQLMPELAEIGGWPQCGSRRGADVMGRIFYEPIMVEFDGD